MKLKKIGIIIIHTATLLFQSRFLFRPPDLPFWGNSLELSRPRRARAEIMRGGEEQFVSAKFFCLLDFVFITNVPPTSTSCMLSLSPLFIFLIERGLALFWCWEKGWLVVDSPDGRCVTSLVIRRLCSEDVYSTDLITVLEAAVFVWVGLCKLISLRDVVLLIWSFS